MPDQPGLDPPDRRSRRDPEVAERILHAGLALFDDLGFDSVNVKQIATRAGVGPMTVYRTFGTKAGIVFWTRDLAADRLLNIARARPVDADPRAAVAGCLRQFGTELPLDVEHYDRILRIIAGSPRLQVVAHSNRWEFEQALLTGLSEAGGAASLPLRVACAAGVAALQTAVRGWHSDGQQRREWLAEIDAALAALWPDIGRQPRRR